MPLRKARPFTLRPGGVSDAVDPTNSPRGVLTQLSNLIPDPSTAGLYVPRPASKLLSLFSNYTAGQVSCFLVVGDFAYGMVASALYPGYDEPFGYDLKKGAFVPILGVTANNIPQSQPAIGDWTPPSIAIVGSRIVVCHPGFSATVGAGTYFGWFDISGLDIALTVNIYNGSLVLDGNPSIISVQPGLQIVSASNLFPRSYVTKTTQYVNDTYGTTASGTNTITNVADTTGIVIGQLVEGVGIQTGTTVTLVAGTTVTISQNAVASTTLGAVTFSGATINIADLATGSANGSTVDVFGGDPGAPQWGAGQMDRNPFVALPTCVGEFNGRAYFGVGSDIIFSDSLLPCRRSDSLATQVLSVADGETVTALAPLMLNSILTGGIVQALLVFEGAGGIRQITGDPTTQNLTMNAMPVATGTNAPNTITTCELGTAFMSPEGLRIVKFDGTVTPPVGDNGVGVVMPFINALYPSRAVAASGHGILRISVQRNDKPGNPYEEWWYDLSRRIWTGPHTFPAAFIQRWRDTFVMVPVTMSAIWQSDPTPATNSSYVENGAVLTWSYGFLLPDAGDNEMQALVDSTLGLQLPWLGATVNLQAIDMSGEGLSFAAAPAPASEDFWGVMNWEEGRWSGTGEPYQQYSIDWDQPLVFKQLRVNATGQSAAGVRIGNFSGKMQQLGYKLAA